MFCEKCGAPNVDGAAFCSGCGASLNSSPFRPAQPLQPAKPLPVQPQSAAAQPVVPQPVAPQPVVPQPQHRVPEAWPVAPQPVAPQPVVPQPVVPQPVAPQPVVPQPVAPQPVVPQPVAPQPVVPQPQPRVLETWPVAPQPQSVAPQSWPVEPQTQYNVGSAEMSTPKKSKKKIWVLISLIVAILIAAAVAVYFIWVKDSGKDDSEQKSTTVSTKNANDSPENVALAYAKASLTADEKLFEESVRPEMLSDDVLDEFEQLKEYVESMDIEIEDIEITDTTDMDEDDVKDFSDYMLETYDFEVSDAKTIEVSYVIVRDDDEEPRSIDIGVMKVDGKWYAYPET